MSSACSPFPPQGWRDAHRLDDALFAAAYDALNGRERASLKKCIARLHRVWGERPEAQSATRRYAEGFCLTENRAPAAFALIACPVDCASPAALLAALLPALLAGVRTLLPCFIRPENGDAHAQKSSPAPKKGRAVSSLPGAPPGALPGLLPDAPLLAALELAGVEEAFCLDAAQLADCLATLGPEAVRGRLLLLGQANFCRKAASQALSVGLVCRALPAPPLYFSLERSAASEQRFAPAAAVPPHEADESLLTVALDQEHEDVWIWPDLGPDWFLNRRMRLAALETE